jgi:hypothetical protein
MIREAGWNVRVLRRDYGHVPQRPQQRLGWAAFVGRLRSPSLVNEVALI